MFLDLGACRQQMWRCKWRHTKICLGGKLNGTYSLYVRTVQLELDMSLGILEDFMGPSRCSESDEGGSDRSAYWQNVFQFWIAPGPGLFILDRLLFLLEFNPRVSQEVCLYGMM